MWNRKQLCGRKKIHTVLGSRKRERENVINKHVLSCILVASARAYMMTRYRKPVIRVFKLFNSSCLFSLSLSEWSEIRSKLWCLYFFNRSSHRRCTQRVLCVCGIAHWLWTSNSNTKRNYFPFARRIHLLVLWASTVQTTNTRRQRIVVCTTIFIHVVHTYIIKFSTKSQLL